jgi:hypothetical protein
MANNFADIDKDELLRLADTYCDFCIESTRQIATGGGKVVDIKERHLPTVNYFLYHWLRREHFDFYKRANWYKAMNNDNHPLVDTIKNIDEQFNSLAADIVANEGKGIFYAKNKLGMTDTSRNENNNTYKLVDETSNPKYMPYTSPQIADTNIIRAEEV